MSAYFRAARGLMFKEGYVGLLVAMGCAWRLSTQSLRFSHQWLIGRSAVLPCLGRTYLHTRSTWQYYWALHRRL